VKAPHGVILGGQIALSCGPIINAAQLLSVLKPKFRRISQQWHDLWFGCDLMFLAVSAQDRQTALADMFVELLFR
jgi:hypothetical protein